MQSIQDKIKQYLTYLSPYKTAYATFTDSEGKLITNSYPYSVWQSIEPIYQRMDNFEGVIFTK